LRRSKGVPGPLAGLPFWVMKHPNKIHGFQRDPEKAGPGFPVRSRFHYCLTQIEPT
jgi:hypothetical protein